MHSSYAFSSKSTRVCNIGFCLILSWEIVNTLFSVIDVIIILLILTGLSFSWGWRTVYLIVCAGLLGEYRVDGCFFFKFVGSCSQSYLLVRIKIFFGIRLTRYSDQIMQFSFDCRFKYCRIRFLLWDWTVALLQTLGRVSDFVESEIFFLVLNNPVAFDKTIKWKSISQQKTLNRKPSKQNQVIRRECIFNWCPTFKVICCFC